MNFLIASLHGIVLEKTPNTITIDCGGVGYLAFISTADMPRFAKQGEKTTVYTYLNISENDMSLFGFFDIQSKEIFQLLISVSGIGPKAGLAILSALDAQQIILSIKAKDYKTFTIANGVGPKTAQRLVLELYDKVNKNSSFNEDTFLLQGNANAATNTNENVFAKATAALVALGYSQTEAYEALRQVDETLATEEMIREALKAMAKGK